MLLDGSVVERMDQQEAMHALISDVFQQDQPLHSNAFEKSILKLSSVHELLDFRLRSGMFLSYVNMRSMII